VRYWTGTDGGALAGDGFIIRSSDADQWRQLSRDVRLGSTISRPPAARRRTTTEYIFNFLKHISKMSLASFPPQKHA
jgi:hypothetical protein